MGSIGENAIDEFTFLGWRSEAPGAGIFNVHVNLQNDGNEAVDVENYTWGVIPYKENGQEVSVSASGPVSTEYEGKLAAGDNGHVSYHLRVDDASVIDSYEIYLSCDGYDADGAYCSE